MGERKAVPGLTRRELEVMKVVWRLGRATVRQVYEGQRQKKKLAYTSLMTVMKILEQKGVLRHEVEGRAYVYYPTVSRSQITNRMVKDLVQRLFDGSAAPLVLHLLEEEKFTPDTLKEIEEIVRKHERS